ncbi:MAG TPA: DUF3501 family protein [Candidatus Dormibacteraeota bacterium]|jgi:hypothetical protein
MRPLAVDEVRPPAAYEAVRAEALHRLLEQRRPRSIPVGDLITLLFENRTTVAGAVEEQLRAGQIDEPDRIAEEVAVFNALIPGERELTGTLFLETEDAAAQGRWMRELPGISGHVHLEVDGVRAERVVAGPGAPELGDEPVEHLRFRLTEAQCAAIAGGGEAVVCCDHPAHRARTVLDEAQRRALAEDLGR